MTNRSVTVTSLIALMSVASIASAHSFSSTKGLIDSVRNDAAALQRYESHFGMNRDEVIAFLGELHPGTLAKTGTFAICEPAFGAIETQVSLKLEKGEAVFLDKSNTPVLLAEGGYPMTESLNDDSVEQTAPVSSADSMPATATSAATPMAMMAPGASMVSGGGQNYQWLTAVPVIIPILGATNTFGGSDSNGGSITPVPEPASFAILGVGALGLLRRRKKA